MSLDAEVSELVARARAGEETALAELFDRFAADLRREADRELAALNSDRAADEVWQETQGEARRRLAEFTGSGAAEFGAWLTRILRRQIRLPRQPRREAQANYDTVAPAAVPSDYDTIAPTAGPANYDTIAPQGSHATPPATPPGEPPADAETVGEDQHATVFAPPSADALATAGGQLAGGAAAASKKFGDYEILQTIARGGMGVVYKARHRKLNRTVALKMILAGQFADQADIDRFYAEAEAAANLRHPHIVGIHEVGQCEGQHYFSMDYIEGQSLADLVREHPLAPRAAARYVKTVSQAMQYAHEQGVLHRDLKPGNVLVDENDQPLVTDFGLAKRTEGQSQMTVAGTVLGTPSYMPPEQAAGEIDQITVRSDVYSLGAILYELLTAKPPFGAANPWETVKQVKESEPISPRALNSSVPKDLETICLKCLQKSPPRRYQSAQELVDELQRYLAGEPIQARPVGFVERSVRWCYRNPWPSTAIATFLAGFVIALVLFFRAEDARQKAETARKNAVTAQERAEANRDLLIAAIEELLVELSEEKLLSTEGGQEIRLQLMTNAKERYLRTLEALRDDQKIQHRLGLSYFLLGRIMQDLREPELAREPLEEARAIQERLDREDPDNVERLAALGSTLNLLGEVLRNMNEFQAARDFFEQAIEKRQRLAQLAPREYEYRRQLVNSQMNSGLIEKVMGDQAWETSTTEATRHYAQAQLRIRDSQQERGKLLLEFPREAPADAKLLRDSAMGDYNLAQLAFNFDDLTATDDYLRSALDGFDRLLARDAREKLVGLEGINLLDVEYQRAQCFFLDGDTKRGPEAAGSYQAALRAMEPLAKNNPGVHKYQVQYAQAHLSIGELRAEHGEYDLAIESFAAAVRILEPVAKNYPEYQAFLDHVRTREAELKQAVSARPPPAESTN